MTLEECMDIAADALKKQIPRRILDSRYPFGTCPTCGGSVYLEKILEHIQSEETTYCEHCGQALDWSDDE